MAEMAFALRGDLLVVVHNACVPGQDRWEQFCRECHRNYVDHNGSAFQSILIASDGGGPDVVQRAQLLKAVERIPIRTAVVSSSTGVRRIHAALQLFNAEVECFDASEWKDAANHVGIGARQFGDVATTLELLCQSVPGAHTALGLVDAFKAEHERYQKKIESGVLGAPPPSGAMGLFQRLRRGA